MVDIGTHAPDFALHDTNREVRTRDEFKGKNIVLAFFPAAFSQFCESELCSFRDVMEELNGLNAVVLGISADGPFANLAFAKHNNLQFPLLSDYSRDVIRAYDVPIEDFVGMPGYTVAQRAVFILDGEGIVRYRWIGENPGKLPDYDRVKAELRDLA